MFSPPDRLECDSLVPCLPIPWLGVKTIKHGVRQIVSYHRGVTVVAKPSHFTPVFTPTPPVSTPVPHHLTVLRYPALLVTTGVVPEVAR